MSTSGSGAPPRPTRKMVLRKIPKEVSFPSATPEAAPHPAKSRLPAPALASPPPPPLPAAARRSAPAIRTDLPPPPAPPAASVATPIPSRISVLPFVAPISPATSDGRKARGNPPRYVLIVCGIALSGVLVGAGVLLGTRMDESPARANGTGMRQPMAASIALPNGSPQASRDQTPTPSNPLIATANVNDLPRAPMPVIRRWTPPGSGGATARIAPARATATASAPLAAAPEPAASEQTTESSESAAAATAAATAVAAAPTPRASASAAPPAPTAAEDAPQPAKPAPSATAQAAPTPDPAPTAPPDPLLDEIKKAVGGSQHK